MSSPAPLSRTVQWLTWSFLAIVILTIGLAYVASHHQPKLPVLGQVSSFSLTNQAGQKVSLDDLRGKVWVGDIIFSRCPGPCLSMTKTMAEVQAALPKDLPVRFVSLTSDPEYDSPAVLEKFGKKLGADFRNWDFLTGPKSNVVDLAVNGMKLVRIEKKPGERESLNDLFVHSTIFVLIDKQGRIRSAFDMLPPPVDDPGTNAVPLPADASKPRDSKQAVIEVIRQLLKED